MTEPSAPVTFLLTDVQGSTRMWQAYPEEMSAAMRLLDEIVERLVSASDGRLVKLRGEGDSHFCVFNDPRDAVIAARNLQLSLAATRWPTPDPIKVRASIHTGRVEFREPDYYGTEVNRAARIRSLAHGGQTLASMTTLALVSSHLPPDVTFHDLGTHRLKDFADPEQIFQLSHPDLASEFPPLGGSSDQRRHNLPTQTTSFVGRNKELGELARLVGEHRLVTVVGPGGSGKSRIAVETGRAFVDEFVDGVWFVELAVVESEVNVARAVADVLRMPERTDVTVSEALVDFLKPRAVLLIVDNAEHVIDAVAILVDRIHKSCEDVRVLVTTREALRLDGEYVWPLGPLAIVDLDELPPLDALAATEAVQLFVDRTRQLQPVFALGADNARPIAEICRRLDGIPLAIELATARVPTLGVEHVASHLDNVFRVLTGGRRTALARQRTLRATIDWSYDLLDEAERKLLERLSIFVGGCTLEAAEAVCSDDELAVEDVDELISSLVTKSLVGTDTAMGDVRYRLLETVRQYAAEKLMASGEMSHLRDRHLRWFVALAETNPPNWMSDGVCRPTQNIRRFWADIGNLRAAGSWAREEGRPEAALAVSVFIADLLNNKGEAGEARDVLRETISDGLPAGPLAQATLLRAYLRLEMRDPAMDDIETALTFARAAGESETVLACLNLKGYSHTSDGRLNEASAAYEELLSAARSAGHDDWTAVGLLAVGEMVRVRGELADSLAMQLEALDLARDPSVRADALTKVAYHRERMDDLVASSQLLQEALDLCVEEGLDHQAAYLLMHQMTVIKKKQQRPREVLDALERAEAIASECEDRSTLEQLRWNRGWFELEHERLADAKASFENSMHGFADLRSEGAAWDVRSALAVIAVEEGDLEAAAKIVRAAADVPAAKASAYMRMHVLLELGEASLARDLIVRTLGSAADEDPRFATWMACAYLGQERYEDAVRFFQRGVSFLIEGELCRSLDSGTLAGFAQASLGAGRAVHAARLLGASTLLWPGQWEDAWVSRRAARRVREALHAALGDAELDRLEEEGRGLWREDRLSFVMSTGSTN